MAIAQQDYEFGTQSYSASIAATYNTACAVGDVLACCVYQSTASSNPVVSVADSVNSGNWSPLSSHFDSLGSASQYSWYFKVANAVGTPVVTATLTGGSYTCNIISRFNGFTGTPTADATVDALGPFANASSTAESATGIVTNFGNELLLLARTQGATTQSQPTGWTPQDTGSYGSSPTFYAVVANSGTTDNFALTYGTATPWQIVVVGLYGAGGSSCTNAGETSTGGQSVPNGTSGSYVGKTGGFVTPNCSSTQYFQPSGGKFGTSQLVAPLLLMPLSWAINRRNKMAKRKSGLIVPDRFKDE